MPRDPRRLRVAAAVGLTALLLGTGVRLVVADFMMPLGSLNDIQGEPSRPAVRAGQVQVTRAAKRYSAQRRKWQGDYSRRQSTVNQSWQVAVARRKTPARPVTTSRPASTPAAPAAPPPSYQDLTLAFVTPNHAAAAGIPLQARIKDASGNVRVVSARTDASGKTHLQRVGPLPATYELEVPADSGLRLAGQTSVAVTTGEQTPAAELAETAAGTVRTAVASEPEWRFQSADDASRALAQGIGTPRSVALGADSSPAPSAPPSAFAFLPTRGFGALVGRLLPLIVGHSASAAAEEAGVSSRRAVVYSYADPQQIVVERTIADVAVSAPAGSRITTPALPGVVQTVPASGKAIVRLPVAALGDGPVPLRVAANLAAGEAESVVTDYSTDPYRVNEAPPAPLRLSHLASCEISQGVLTDQSAITKSYGQPAGSATASLDDGSQLVQYPQRGLAFKMRHTPNGPTVAERVRLTSAQGGHLPGGVTVGATLDAVQQAMGTPTATESTRSIAARLAGEPGTADRAVEYLDGGIVFGVRSSDHTVQWIELARPTPLLVSGTTAFVPRSPARLYIEGFQGDPHTNLDSDKQFAAYLRQLPSIRLVRSADDADLILNAKVTRFKEQRDDFLIKAVPFRYACDVELTYSLTDTVADKPLAKDKAISAGARMDYGKQLAVGSVGLGILALKGGKVGKLAALGLGAVGVVQLQKVVAHAANRCPALASRTVFDQMVGDINRAADYSARVVAVDYQTGRVTLNIGTRQGVAVSTPQRPYEFELGVGDTALPASESGLSADYYSAVVVEAAENSCVCELRHVKRSVQKADEKFSEQPATDMARQLPDPATGVVWARAALRFPPVPLVSETPAPGDDTAGAAGDDTHRSAAPENNNADTNKKSDDPVSGAIDNIFHRKRNK